MTREEAVAEAAHIADEGIDVHLRGYCYCPKSGVPDGWDGEFYPERGRWLSSSDMC